MKLSIKALALTAAILWGGSVLVVGLANLIWEPYAAGFLELIASIYPGYEAGGGFGSVIVGTLYALLDGLVCGFLFAVVYNALCGRARSAGGGDA